MIEHLSESIISDLIHHLQTQMECVDAEEKPHIQEIIDQYQQELDRRAIKTPIVAQQLIDEYIDDMISDFLYYARKEDDELPVGRIEDLVASGKLSIDFIVESFRKHLTIGLKEE